MSSIVQATYTNIAAIVKLVNSAYRSKLYETGWTTEAHLLDGIRTDEESVATMISNPRATTLLYLNNVNDIDGCVYLEKRAGELYLDMLSVQPQVQAKGIGKQLLQASEEYAKEQKVAGIVITVISARTELIDWYKRHGYYLTGETEPFPTGNKFGIPKQPLEFVVMKKQMPA